MFLLCCDRRGTIATITAADIISVRPMGAGAGAELCCVCVCGLPVTVHVPHR